MFRKVVVATFFISFLFFHKVLSFDLCEKFQGQEKKVSLVAELAKKLHYSLDELCLNPRVLDIQLERRSKFFRQTNEIESFVVIALHYSEYSCDYYFLLKSGSWADSLNNCYSTF